MPRGGTIDHHSDNLKYAEAEIPVPADKPFTVQRGPEGKGLTVTGPCPACGGLTSTDFSHGIGGTKGFRGPRPSPIRSPITVFCECGHVHADRPADATDRGCGRYWTVDIPDALRTP
jgi:hypothetical protein